MGELFDDLAKALAKGVSRRKALGGLLAGAVAGVLGSKLAQPEEVVAQRRRRVRRRCRKFCRSAFPNPTFSQGCFEDALAGTGACFECGPFALEEDRVRLTPCAGTCCDGKCVRSSDLEICIASLSDDFPEE
jgi:hypothetical protein